ncbi:uncharacterized protein N7483_009689 [Penicillium malachiteum]|uniref:uncharacterized protein n=1 Tax=Penicillium malachiteum TaxID=1324776 RepID=UPI00254816DD|nr:uncharacterized protein N7483_009689 [Penicillium malachiteum]KAJ5721755.1 hypothetical protein N7483_009689 [Penicillium malachiteum]
MSIWTGLRNLKIVSSIDVPTLQGFSLLEDNEAPWIDLVQHEDLGLTGFRQCILHTGLLHIAQTLGDGFIWILKDSLPTDAVFKPPSGNL